MNFKKSVAIAAAVGALSALAIPAMAETTIYGSARVATAWDTTVLPKSAANAVNGSSQTFFNIDNQATSRLGVKSVNGNLTAVAELGIGDAGVYNLNGGSLGGFNQTGWVNGSGGLTLVYTRHIYGEYKFDSGKLLIGQTWTPYTVVSKQALNSDEGNCYFGALYDGRFPQIKYTLNNGIYVDFIRQATAETAAPAVGTANGQTTAGANLAVNPANLKAAYLPKLAIGYDGKSGAYTYGGGILLQTQKDANGKAVNSELLYAHGTATMGAFDALVNLGLGNNISALAIKDGGSFLAVKASDGASNNPVTTFTALVGVGYTVSPTVKVQAGIGGGTSSTSSDSAAHPVLTYAGYINAPITLAKNVYVTPEYNYIDQLNQASGSTAAGSIRNHIYGAQWRVDF